MLINSCDAIKNYLRSQKVPNYKHPAMKKPGIVSLSSAQRQEVVNTLDEILKENNYRYKDLVLETLDFVKVLMEELKSGKISTNQLKQILLSLDQEALKKLSEIH